MVVQWALTGLRPTSQYSGLIAWKNAITKMYWGLARTFLGDCKVVVYRSNNIPNTKVWIAILMLPLAV